MMRTLSFPCRFSPATLLCLIRWQPNRPSFPCSPATLDRFDARFAEAPSFPRGFPTATLTTFGYPFEGLPSFPHACYDLALLSIVSLVPSFPRRIFACYAIVRLIDDQLAIAQRRLGRPTQVQAAPCHVRCSLATGWRLPSRSTACLVKSARVLTPMPCATAALLCCAEIAMDAVARLAPRK